MDTALTFNRTSMESKRKSGEDADDLTWGLLIEPVWNRNFLFILFTIIVEYF